MRRGIDGTRQLLVFAVALAVGCRGFEDERSARESASRAAESLVVGAVWSHFDSRIDGFWQGLDLAVAEVNRRGGIEGRRIELQKYSDEDSIQRAREVAQHFVDDPEVAAVIGHRSPDVSFVTSIQYEWSGITFICTGFGSQKLNRDGFDRVFRLHPSAEWVAARIAEYAAAADWSRVAVVHADLPYGQAFAQAFEGAAEERRVRVVSRIAFDGGSRSFRRAVRQLPEVGARGIVVAAEQARAEAILEEIREAELGLPIALGDSLATRTFARRPVADGAVVATTFHPGVASEPVAAFTRAFEAEYGQKPDAAAAEAYAAVRALVAAAAVEASSTPAALARGLGTIEGVPSPVGRLSFDDRGRRRSGSINLVRVEDGRFVLIETPAPEASEAE